MALQTIEIYDAAEDYFQDAVSGNTFTKASQGVAPWFRGGGWVDISVRHSAGNTQPTSGWAGLKAQRHTALPVDYVSNLDEVHSAAFSGANSRVGQSFTIPDGVGTHDLGSVQIDFADATAPPNVRVQIWSATGNLPNAQIGSNLVLQGAGVVGVNTFHPASTIQLSENTTYYVAVIRNTINVNVRTTVSDDEDSNAGWTFGDAAVRDNPWASVGSGHSLRMRVDTKSTLVTTARESHGDLAVFPTYGYGGTDTPLIDGAPAVDLAQVAGTQTGTTRYPSSILFLLDPDLHYRMYVTSVAGGAWGAAWRFKAEARASLNPFSEYGLPLSGSGRYSSWVELV